MADALLTPWLWVFQRATVLRYSEVLNRERPIADFRYQVTGIRSDRTVGDRMDRDFVVACSGGSTAVGGLGLRLVPRLYKSFVGDICSLDQRLLQVSPDVLLVIAQQGWIQFSNATCSDVFRMSLVAAAVRDMTERREISDKLIAARQEADRSSRAKRFGHGQP